MEAIRQLKYAYFRCVDTANLEELATLFHDDVTVHFVGGSYEWNVQGKADYVSNIGKSFSTEAVGQHNAHHPEIQMLSDTEATALWYLADNMWILNHNVKTHGTAHLPRSLPEGERQVVDQGHQLRAPLRDQRCAGGASQAEARITSASTARCRSSSRESHVGWTGQSAVRSAGFGRRVACKSPAYPDTRGQVARPTPDPSFRAITRTDASCSAQASRIRSGKPFRMRVSGQAGRKGLPGRSRCRQ